MTDIRMIHKTLHRNHLIVPIPTEIPLPLLYDPTFGVPDPLGVKCRGGYQGESGMPWEKKGSAGLNKTKLDIFPKKKICAIAVMLSFENMIQNTSEKRGLFPEAKKKTGAGKTTRSTSLNYPKMEQGPS